MDTLELLTLSNVGKFCEFTDIEYGDKYYVLIDYCDQDDCYFFVDIESRDDIYTSDLDGYVFTQFVTEEYAVSTLDESYRCSTCGCNVPVSLSTITSVDLVCSSCKSTEKMVKSMEIQKNVYIFNDPCQLLVLRSFFKGINNSNVNDCISGLFVVNIDYGDFNNINHFTIIPSNVLT